MLCITIKLSTQFAAFLIYYDIVKNGIDFLRKKIGFGIVCLSIRRDSLGETAKQTAQFSGVENLFNFLFNNIFPWENDDLDQLSFASRFERIIHFRQIVSGVFSFYYIFDF